ncbi:MAG: serine/threonine protein kinase [Deltaproteobacteria bacterium]|nr:serine/threonine protein kinase [Deltaproteobacteria bacterium]
MSFDPQGQVLEGKYRLLRQLGEGGMGVVWAAEHVRLGRPLAVKLLRGDLADNPRTLQRFHQEAVAASRIGNPHIVEVIDLGTAPNNAPFIVMELLEGQTLYDLLQDQPVLPVGRAVDILCQVLSGLAAAHAKNIVHRDLKPANVFLTRYGNRDDFVKLVDFGVSKILGSDAQLTRSGALLGTPTYMAPEQVLARRRLDHRVDLWAAGVILYLALTGRRPHEASTRNELLVRIVNSDVKPIRPQRREVDEPLERAVLRALQRDVDRRWPSAEMFRDALLPYRVQGSIVPAAGRATPIGVPTGAARPGARASSSPTSSAPPPEDQTVSTPGLVPSGVSSLGSAPRTPSFSAPSALPEPPGPHPAAAAVPAARPRPARDSASQVPTEPRLERGAIPTGPVAAAPPEVDSERVSVVWEIAPAARPTFSPTTSSTTIERRDGGWRWILAALVLGLGLIAAVSIITYLGRRGDGGAPPPADAAGAADAP